MLNSGLIVLLVLSITSTCLAIQCYQCDSDFDENCRPDKPFDDKINALVDCLSDEANVPGTYCVKKEYRSPGWWGWHKVTRRCGSSTGLGSTSTCFWGRLEDRGVYVRECNCNTEGCNSAPTPAANIFITCAFLLYTLLFNMH
ncbi:UPAR/Ly6 domain-containing protein crok-like [Watersipora subatra]|uniref:UPAR/Ly6 domain-containing protein crok-like n=1 Tax=Watersipora subatra TaxID=2589382 RepID=UPI00355C1947